MKEKSIPVEKEGHLLEYLIENTSYAKNKCKSLLKYENISVNGKIETKFDFPLKKGDQIQITNTRKVHPPFRILYEDKEFFIVHKKERLLTSSPNAYERTLQNDVISYLKAKKAKETVYVLHRLDKETSGIVIFCKNQDLTTKLQENWNHFMKLRGYVAVVEGRPQQDAGTLRFYLQEHNEKNVTISDEKQGKLAITNYQVKKSNQDYSLVTITIETGRKNQIRASFAHIGHSVVGDKKYYATGNPIHRVALAANCIEFIHPVTKKVIRIEEAVPKEFLNLVK